MKNKNKAFMRIIRDYSQGGYPWVLERKLRSAPREYYFSKTFNRTVAVRSEAWDYVLHFRFGTEVGGSDEKEWLQRLKDIAAEDETMLHLFDYESQLAAKAAKAVKFNHVDYFMPKKIQFIENSLLAENKKVPLRPMNGAVPNFPKMYFGRKRTMIRRHLLPEGHCKWLLGIYEVGNRVFEIIEGDSSDCYCSETSFEIPKNIGKKRFFLAYLDALKFLQTDPPKSEMTIQAAISRGHQLAIYPDNTMYWVTSSGFKLMGSTPWCGEEGAELIAVIETCFNYPWAIR